MELLFVLLSFVMEAVDSSIGMMYGTLLSPILVGLGHNPLIVVPAILLSQAVGGVIGSIFHHKFDNADFSGLTKDMKVALAMIVPGLLVVVLGVFAAVNLPKLWVKTYIAITVLVMSGLCLTNLKYTFAWWKHYIVGALAAFNKALTGGGFGPVTSTGGIIGGLTARVSVATTTMAEVIICFGSFLAYMLISGTIDWTFTLVLCLGAIGGGVLGPWLSSKIPHEILRKVIAWFGIASGSWLLGRLYL